MPLYVSPIFLFQSHKVGVGDDNDSGLPADELSASLATLESISATLDADCVRYNRGRTEKFSNKHSYKEGGGAQKTLWPPPPLILWMKQFEC